MCRSLQASLFSLRGPGALGAMRTIATERLRLVPVTVKNANVLWNVLQQPDLREHQDLPDVDAEQFARMVAARPVAMRPGAHGRFEWLIYRRGEPDPAGWVSLRIGDRSTTVAEIGYSVLREQRGRGFAAEAVGALIDESFGRGHLRRVRAYCVPENMPSRTVLARTGFERDGVLPNGATVQGRAVDVLAFVIEREAWEARRKPRG